MKNLKVAAFAIMAFAAVMFFGNVKAVHAQSGSFEWRGSVDDVVEVRIRDRDADTRTISGQETNDSSYNFDGRGGRGGRNQRDRGNASVEKKDGRGKVFVVQQPSRRNNWTTVIQIVDSKGGSDRYRFTVYWN